MQRPPPYPGEGGGRCAQLDGRRRSATSPFQLLRSIDTWNVCECTRCRKIRSIERRDSFYEPSRSNKRGTSGCLPPPPPPSKVDYIATTWNYPLPSNETPEPDTIGSVRSSLVPSYVRIPGKRGDKRRGEERLFPSCKKSRVFSPSREMNRSIVACLISLKNKRGMETSGWME